MWLARSQFGALYLFYDKEAPIKASKAGIFVEKGEDDWVQQGKKKSYQIDFKLFPEVTWRNSPVELILKSNDKRRH